jgi:hypothetical protein
VSEVAAGAGFGFFFDAAEAEVLELAGAGETSS